MKITCDCGHESEFNVSFKDERQFFQNSEEVIVGDFDSIIIDIANPAIMSYEISCQKCGRFYRTSGRFNQ